MDAIILAGGEGARLRAVTGGMPKPMVPILGEPVLAHILRLLRKNGIGRARVALRHMPRIVTDYFGDEFEGLPLSYNAETAPRGTAGAARDCAPALGGEDFLVVPGDCVCDFDLGELMSFYRGRKSEAVIALRPVPEPTEYGLVVCAPDGGIEKFSEKPAWEGVVTDMVSTGIYIVSRSVLREIPERGEYDFGRDLFPRLLASGRGVRGLAMRGYWRDIGTPGEYYACVRDAEAGRVRLSPSHGKAAALPGLFPETRKAPEFTRRGEISLEPGTGAFAADCLRLGLAAGAFGRVGICRAGGEAARVASGLIADGVNAAGGDSVSHDAVTPAEAAFAARRLGLPLSVFVTRRCAAVKIRFLGENGGALPRVSERRLLVPVPPEAAAEGFGSAGSVTGIGALYIEHIARIASAPETAPIRVRVRGSGAAARALREALTLAGGYEPAEARRGVVSFEPSPDGETCSARSESGAEADHGHLLAAAAAAHFKRRRGKLTLPADAPEAIGVLAARFGGELCRDDKNPAEWSRDGAALAAELCAYMRSCGAGLDDLMGLAPRFALAELEMPLRTGRGAVMRRLSAGAEAGDMLDSGLVLRSGGASAVVSPLRRENALRIRAEAESSEKAGLLCAELARRAREADAIPPRLKEYGDGSASSV
ncbi:MAG: NTP transferase domain-containing protein [Oscillospiraceae bacterium]|nr:NTP transferase domain-containing protein [Oscillospiraceae bacterium]